MMVGRVLEAGAEVATATHHLAAAAEARIEAAGRLAASADDPAVRAAAGRVAQSAAARPPMDGMMIGVLPLVAPVLDFTASVSHGESLPRAFAGALGGAIGADLGGRAGLAMCGGTAAATQGVGLIVCPTVTAVGGALGAQAGKAAALHVYDELTKPDTGPSRPEPAHRSRLPPSRRRGPRRSGRGRCRGREGDAMGMGVDVHGVAAEETDQGHADLLGQLHGQAGGGADGGDQGHAGDGRLLDDLERAPPGHEQHHPGQREPALGGRPADHLVDGVVAPDVLTDAAHVAIGPADGGGVEAPVCSNTRWASRTWSGMVASTPLATDGPAPARFGQATVTASIDALPQTPHDEEVTARRSTDGSGTGTPGRRSTVSTLSSCACPSGAQNRTASTSSGWATSRSLTQ